MLKNNSSSFFYYLDIKVIIRVFFSYMIFTFMIKCVLNNMLGSEVKLWKV